MVKISVSGPSITKKEIDYVVDAVTNAWYGNANIYHERFEKAFSSYLSVKHSIALPSCTSAIHLSLLALGVGPGDEVIVPDITWIASSAPISYVGAKPVFADVDEKTWCLSSKSFEECITSHTKAVIPVDIYGNMSDMDTICKIANERGIAVIEDAAEAIGSEYKAQKAGSFGDIGVFSFHGSKTMTTGEGGMLVTNNDDIYERVLFLRDHGRAPGDVQFLNSEVAFKYKMSSMQAALGLAQIERIEELVAKKRKIFEWYKRELAQCPEITLNCETHETKNSYWMVTVIFDEKLHIIKEDAIKWFKENNIDCRPFFYPLSSLPAYCDTLEAKKGKERNHVAYRLSPLGVNLPCGMDMTEEKVRFVTDVLKDYMRYKLKLS